MEYKDYYQTLGVERNASEDDIKRAYRKLARKYHPDVSQESDAETRFKDIGEAYEVLKDTDKRAAYDQFGSDWRAGQEFRPPPNSRGRTGFEFRSGGGSDSGFSDFFESLFGSAGGPFQGTRTQSGGHTHQPGRQSPQDQHAKINIALEDSYSGTTRSITLQSVHTDRVGHPQTQARTLNVKIPKGISAGQRIRLSGQAADGQGDLLLEVVFQDHPLYRVENGKDLYLDLPIAPWEAALGATVTVPTLGGKVDLKIPAGAQSSQKLRLKQRGLPGNPPGDLYLVLKMVAPQAESRKARELYQQLAAELSFNPRATLGG